MLIDFATSTAWLVSQPYCTAMLSACIEHYLIIKFFPSLLSTEITIIGLMAVIVGDFIRKLAIVTAGENFTHEVSMTKRPHHTLVDGGVYRFVRHPSYCGWFIWVIGTQLLLCNPICSVVFAVVSWKFFKRRIAVEELLLVDFFGNAYESYKLKVASGIPFIP